MIRKAKIEDSLPIAQLMLMAMEDIVYAFIGSNDPQQALDFMHQLVQESDNQYSFENTWVVEEKSQIIGSITVYHGAHLERLRQPVLSLLAKRYHRIVNPENETGSGEIYIDTIAVHPDHRGKGWGRGLLNYIIDLMVYQNGETVGLLVDPLNKRAKDLYLRLGFEKSGQRKLMGHTYEHLQLKARIGHYFQK